MLFYLDKQDAFLYNLLVLKGIFINQYPLNLMNASFQVSSDEIEMTFKMNVAEKYINY